MDRLTGIGGHQSARMLKDEWLTPPYIVASLGHFDLDPCSPVKRPWDTARFHYDMNDNGLLKEWNGRVWCNPPYGLDAAHWLAKMVGHGNGMALIFARTETDMFFRFVWEKADAVFFFRGRLFFYHVDGRKAQANAGAPSCLVAYGKNNVDAIKNSGLEGQLILLKG